MTDERAETTGPEPEATRNDWDPSNDPDGYTHEDVQPKDIYLQTILGFYTGSNDQGEGAIGMTLQLNGSIVSGIAISRKTWMDATIKSLTTAAGTEMGEAVSSVFDLINDKYIERHDKRDQADLPLRRREFVHMKDVRVTVCGANDSYGLPLWRGSLDDVTGWSLGSWNPPREDGLPASGGQPAGDCS